MLNKIFMAFKIAFKHYVILILMILMLVPFLGFGSMLFLNYNNAVNTTKLSDYYSMEAIKTSNEVFDGNEILDDYFNYLRDSKGVAFAEINILGDKFVIVVLGNYQGLLNDIKLKPKELVVLEYYKSIDFSKTNKFKNSEKYIAGNDEVLNSLNNIINEGDKEYIGYIYVSDPSSMSEMFGNNKILMSETLISKTFLIEKLDFDLLNDFRLKLQKQGIGISLVKNTNQGEINWLWSLINPLYIVLAGIISMFFINLTSIYFTEKDSLISKVSYILLTMFIALVFILLINRGIIDSILLLSLIIELLMVSIITVILVINRKIGT